MAFLIELDEGTAARRRVPFRVFASNGTSPDTGASDGTALLSTNGGAQAVSNNSISAISANAGMYYVELDQSEVGTLGSIAVYTDAVGVDFPQHVANVQVVNFNPMSTQSGVLLGAQEYSDVTVRIGLVAYSGATVGAGNFAPGTYSGVSFSVRNSGIAPTSYQAGTYSNLTVQGAVRLDSNVTLKAATHSGATIQGLSNYANISDVTLHAGTHSDATVQGVTRVNSNVTVGGLGNDAAISIASYVWNESRSSHSSPLGSFGASFQIVSVSTTQGGTTSSVTLNSAETSTNDFYNGCLLMIEYPSGFRVGALISDYTGSNQEATLEAAVPVAIPSGATYVIYPGVDSDLTVKIAAGSYSDVTVQGLSNYANISDVTLHEGNHSGATIDGISFVATAGERSIASSWMSTNLGNSRLAQEYLFPLRNRVQISGSTMTVYHPDDSTSAWTASVTTTDNALSGIDPVG